MEALDIALQLLLSEPELFGALVFFVLGLFGVRRELQLRAARKAAALVEEIHEDDDVARGAIESHLTGATPLTHPDAKAPPARPLRPGAKLAAKLAARALREARDRRYVAAPPRSPKATVRAEPSPEQLPYGSELDLEEQEEKGRTTVPSRPPRKP